MTGITEGNSISLNNKSKRTSSRNSKFKAFEADMEVNFFYKKAGHFPMARSNKNGVSNREVLHVIALFSVFDFIQAGPLIFFRRSETDDKIGDLVSYKSYDA